VCPLFLMVYFYSFIFHESLDSTIVQLDVCRCLSVIYYSDCTSYSFMRVRTAGGDSFALLSFVTIYYSYYLTFL
jgi:hypothetical protein